MDLKPCPFCGSTNLRTGFIYSDDDGETEGVECMNCDAIARTERWNDRPGESLPIGIQEALRP